MSDADLLNALFDPRHRRPFGPGRSAGTPIARRYWYDFLARHRDAARGRCLEVGGTGTLGMLGGAAVTAAEALELVPGPGTAVVADLARADHVPADGYDLFLVPFTFHVIHDVEAALWHAVRLLRPGGSLIANFMCVEYNFPRGLDMGTGGTLYVHWFFTPLQVHNLMRRAGIAAEGLTVEVYGNLPVQVAYQINVPAERVPPEVLARRDPGFPVMVAVRAVKPAGWNAPKPVYRDPWLPEGEPARWTPAAGHYDYPDPPGIA